jgi:hypothetical protein
MPFLGISAEDEPLRSFVTSLSTQGMSCRYSTGHTHNIGFWSGLGDWESRTNSAVGDLEGDIATYPHELIMLLGSHDPHLELTNYPQLIR